MLALSRKPMPSTGMSVAAPPPGEQVPTPTAQITRGRATSAERRRCGYATAPMGCGMTRTSPTGTRGTDIPAPARPTDHRLCPAPPAPPVGPAGHQGGPPPHRLPLRPRHRTGQPRLPPQRPDQLPHPAGRRQPCRPSPRPCTPARLKEAGPIHERTSPQPTRLPS
ncbi:hypothetical protein STPH1_7282 [Streptomyces sp. OM5714]|nr:hypothetical protein STPH1_7277 [Streptomyces sp. OM5714]KAF2775095.1 hypothetical protein STPH1_7282 [Streptomyces sp. OM5714]